MNANHENEIRALTADEMQAVSGGFWNFVAGFIAGKVIDAVIDDVRNGRGFMDKVVERLQQQK